MIIDRLAHAGRYAGLGEGLAKALQFLTDSAPEHLAPGRHDIDGERIFALVQDYRTKPIEEGFWEAHRRYIDLQFVAAGRERIGYANLEQLRAGPYDEASDLIRLEGRGDFFEVPAGTFVILMPQDAHMPGIAAGGSAAVKKIVVKVAA